MPGNAEGVDFTIEPVNAYHTAYISVGSNMGERLENCRRGMAALIRSGRCRLIDQSCIYKTEPVDYVAQHWFVNYVSKIETTRDPFSLMDLLASIEISAGRVRDGIRFGPRVLDLDIIFYDDLIVDESRLKIPHPRMHERHFVLKPVCDISPEMMHPVFRQTMQSLLNDLDKTGQGIHKYK